MEATRKPSVLFVYYSYSQQTHKVVEAMADQHPGVLRRESAEVLAYGGLVGSMVGLLLWPGVALHRALATWCALCLAVSHKESDG
jgi:hypothetical protein